MLLLIWRIEVDHEFSNDHWRSYDVTGCRYWVIDTAWTIPNDSVSKLKPPWNAVKILVYNASNDQHSGMSPGFFLTDPLETTPQPTQGILEGTDITGQGAVRPPSGRAIAAHGAVVLGAGLGLIIVALLGQWIFLKLRPGKSERTEKGTGQEKLNLTHTISHTGAGNAEA